MALRQASLMLCVLSVGCQSVTLPEAAGEQPTARQLWVKGQEAMRQGKAEEAIKLYEQSLAADGGLKRNHLSLAAAYLEKGDEAGAEPHLAKYIAEYPEHYIVRAHHAELLLKLGRPKEARAEFERFVADVQDVPELASRHLIHCHSRLMEIAEAEQDEYHEHLHRGIGLYLLALERARLGDPEEGELCVEGVLCRAAGELTLARLARRDEARPSWYLYEVWSRLGQRQPALRHLREADAAAPFSDLTPAEKRRLQLACRDRECEGRAGR